MINVKQMAKKREMYRLLQGNGGFFLVNGRDLVIFYIKMQGI